MKDQAVNPYLPSWEYIPDGEPHVFGDRVYVYGSHDHFGAPIFCVGDYVCWSAPVNDLSDWRCDGVIFRKKQDPKNHLGLRLLFAPDVCQGPDGRFYLYYAFDFMGIMGVAVSDRPDGPYEFLGHIQHLDGILWGRRKGDQFPFDPGILADDDGRIWLYSGFYTPTPRMVTGMQKLRNDGGVVVELEPDMMTIRQEPKLLFPKTGPGSFAGHEFFEASSIRKDQGRYLFVYSSRHNHELCYAESDRPDGGFVFKGTLVSQGDLFLNGNEDENHAKNYLGNTHGGLLHLGDDWYIFYHRQTNQHSYSRQACAEKLFVKPDGSFAQAEVTSCGLNGGPLKGLGTYEARIACNLWSKDGTGRYDGSGVRKKLKDHPYFTQSGKDRESDPDQYIANMRDGSVAGFKYFSLGEAGHISVTCSGKGFGYLEVSTDEAFSHLSAEVAVNPHGNERETTSASFSSEAGTLPLYFRYRGSGAINFHFFSLLA